MSLFDWFNPHNDFQAKPVVNGFQATPMGGVNGADPMLGNAQQNFAQQGDLINMLRGQAEGTGPSVAQNLLAQQTDRNNANAASSIASQRGMNPGLAAKLILDQQAGNQQQAAGQGATLRAQEMLSGRSLLGSALGQQAQSNLGAGNLALGQQGQRLQDYWGAQGINAGVAGQNAQLAQGAQSINAGVSAQNAQTGGQLLGGLLGGIGGGLSMMAGMPSVPSSGTYSGGMPVGIMAHGGEVGGHASAPGDSPKNDVIHAMLSPHEIVLPRSVTLADDAPERARDFVRAIKGRMPKKNMMFAHGGEAGYPNPDALENPMDPGPEASMPAGGPTPSTVAFFNGHTLGGPEEMPAAPSGPGMLARPSEEPVAPPAVTPAPARPAPQKQSPNPTGEMLSGQRQQIEGIEGQAEAASGFAANQTRIMDSWNQARAELNAKHEEALKEHQARADALFNSAMKDGVNPNQYWEHVSTGGKIASAIGMVLGGIGSGLTGQPNAALQVIDKAIDRDVEAQKLNLNKKVNLLSKYMEMGHDMQQAHLLTSADMHDAAAAQLARAAAAFQGTKAGADAQVLIGQERQLGFQRRQQATREQMQTDNAKLSQEFLRRAMTGGSGSKALQTLGFMQHPEKFAEVEVDDTHDVPTGASDKEGKPLTTSTAKPYRGKSPEMAKEAGSLLMHQRNMENSLGILEKFSKKHALGGTPGTEDVGEAQAAAMNLRMNYESSMAQMNRQPSPMVFEHIDQIVKDPTAFFKTGKTAGGLKFLRHVLNDHHQNILDTYTLGPE